jgi:hypothetical protein
MVPSAALTTEIFLASALWMVASFNLRERKKEEEKKKREREGEGERSENSIEEREAGGVLVPAGFHDGVHGVLHFLCWVHISHKRLKDFKPEELVKKHERKKEKKIMKKL